MTFKNSLKRFIAVSVVMLIATSCVSRKKVVYFQDNVEMPSEGQSFDVIFEPGDILDVIVSSSDPELAKDYNQAEISKQNFQNTTYENGIPAKSGYLVYQDSTIDMPVIGSVKVGGLNRADAVDSINSILRNHLENPNVSINILNFKVTVLGDVKNPGTFVVPNERLTVIEAIGIAKDLNITARRDNIVVIRQENGVSQRYEVDITSPEVFNSPVYYLKQNDVVYVEPNKKARYDGSIFKATGGIILSATSLIISTFILLK